jgi:hypothetical protein
MTRLAGSDELAALLDSLRRAPKLEGDGWPPPLPKRTRPGRARPRGRPSKLTPRLTRRLCDALRRGHPPRTACALAGVPHSTFYAWLERGKDDFESDLDTPLARFAASVGRARAELIDRLLRVVDGGRPGWRAAIWLLEQRAPQHFALGWRRRQAQRRAARADVARAARRGERLPASWFARCYDALTPGDREQLAAGGP